MRIISYLIIVYLVLTLSSCSDDNTTEPEESALDVQGTKGFVGKINGTEAFIAFVVFENEVVVYACNDEEEISEWFRNSISEHSKMNITNSSGSSFVANFEDNTYTGEIKFSNGDTHSFTAKPNNREDGGIYRVSGEVADQNEIEGGWIINDLGEERGAFRISNVFQNRSGTRFGDISDGTSNTLSLFGFSLTFVHFTFP